MADDARLSPAAPRYAVRPADTSDPAEVDRLYEICLRTGDSGEDATDRAVHPRLIGDLFLGPYLAFEPELAFVLVDETRTGPDAVVGYVLGVRDSAAFDATVVRDWLPAVRERYPLAQARDASLPVGTVDAMFIEILHDHHGPDPAFLDLYPAHLHVDVLPQAQGGGNGRALLETLFGVLRGLGVPGVHLGMAAGNVRAGGFYAHLGFMQLAADENVVHVGLRL
ncbi:GNAT family N-acetyltransferase [Sanguibacter antarcticus]|uniref:Acetyltransferase (GNAT) family protein n=1 Tax=Sanguibacter antarcticus TaxID=372484 RepID=A0A2A9E7I0_9MICO|nr:GNAT family N-acetyltransferase [Sanguibacter antarcticus]PFG34521.1 acetyltransferase (GNAT) family protein [Sanguibacter antarcticus]